MDITVYVTSPLTSSERKISTQWSLEYLKTKLHPITGIEPKYQQIYLYPVSHSNERRELKVQDGEKESLTTLASFGISEFMRIHVKDLDPNSSLLELDTEAQDQKDYKFELRKEDYEKREDSVISWKKKNQLGRFDPTFEAKKKERELKLLEKVSSMSVGQRCKVENDGTFERIGTIKYIGKVPEIDSTNNSSWCGIQFDEPVGKNDGSIKGKRYFQCPNEYGSFVSPLLVEVGDFPVDNELFEDSDDDEI